jgi:hypothetical protein
MNKFVFVVCGGKEHIEELNFSLKYLRHFSKNEIIVITDLSRNEIKIENNTIIDIVTPIEFDNHQASIFLKTSINHYLEKGHLYCYLDGDIEAVSNQVDEIFKKFNTPISFAADHCKINEFSPHALNCDCDKKVVEQEIIFNSKLSELFGKINLTNETIRKQSEELLSIFNNYRSKPIKNLFKNICYLLKRYIIPLKSFELSNYKFNKKNKCWYNSDKNIILFDYGYYEKKLWQVSGIRFNKKNLYWEDKAGNKFEFKAPVCNHLTNYLKKEYDVEITENWQHWNGGVFLFDDSSTEFLDYWHKQTIKEFSNPYTKTRDQRTLALSAWKFGLQSHPTISQEFNWITEYSNNDIVWSKLKGYSRDGFKTIFQPAFLHIYHEWGKTGWSIWDSIIVLKEIEKI